MQSPTADDRRISPRWLLTVAIAGRSFVISPDQAVWLPAGVSHRVGSLAGAEFRSLWVVQDAGAGLPAAPIVHAVRPLLKALIVEIADLPRDGDGYAGRVTQLILDQLRRAAPIPAALSWRRDEALAELCVALYADHRSAGQWARALGMSSRTLSRRFETEIGMSLRSWRRRMRLFKAVERLGGGMDVRSSHGGLVPAVGLEPTTYRLQGGCSTN